MQGHRPVLRVAAALAILALVVGPVAPPTIGRLTGQAGATGSFTTDPLDPPTGLAVMAGAIASLSWVPTSDHYAGGYDVMRSLVSGSGHLTVASPSPRTVSSYADTPATDGTYYYVLTSTASNWTSAQTAQVTADVFMGVTGFLACTAHSAELGGDGDGYELAPENGCVVDAAVAQDVDTGLGAALGCAAVATDKHRFTSFGIALPPAVTSIDGISVRVKAAVDATAGTNRICAELSWDNGLSYTAAQSVDLTSTTLTTHTLGGPAFLWGRAWALGNFSNANLRVRLIDYSSVATRDFSLDSVQVQVNYTP